MHDCCPQNGHSKCTPVSYSPLRLLTVGLDGNPLKLVDRGTTSAPTEYATLSYCWGNSLQLRTTKETLSQFSEAIPSELLPKTFTDAIRIARALQIPHIWIDALCIVQDDEEEWQSEAANMSEIYQGSLLTITAAQSVNSSQGCFLPNEPSFQNGALFFHTELDGSDGHSSLVRVYRDDVRDRVVAGSAISSRGWTLQESLLSPRLVFCMQPEIHWQCRTNYQMQSGLSFKPEEMVNSGTMVFPYRDPQLGDQWCRTAWRCIVERYTVREFTFSRDRIPAIAGITRCFASVLDDASILGLWRKSFARDLGWWRGGDRPQISDISGLPSWTWITCRGYILYTIGINYADQDVQVVENLKLLDWAVQWQGIPYTSLVKSAQVRVEGPIREIKIAPFAEGNRYTPPYFQVFGEDLKPCARTMVPWRCAGQFDAGDASMEDTYLCLLLFSETKSSNPGYVCESFLILQPAELDVSLSYRRLGFARIWGESPTFDSTKTMSIVLI